jgi:hypothetical protein
MCNAIVPLKKVAARQSAESQPAEILGVSALQKSTVVEKTV